MVVTDDEHLVPCAPSRCTTRDTARAAKAWIGPRPFLVPHLPHPPKLEGAVLLAQVRRVVAIREHLSANAALVRSDVEEVPRIEFRKLPDPEGDLATHLVVIFPSQRIAERVTAELGSITLDRSGWHVYSHMEHLLARRTATERGYPFHQAGHEAPGYRVGMLPATDALLARSMSFSIGVHDPNLAPLRGPHLEHPTVAAERAGRFREVALRHLH